MIQIQNMFLQRVKCLLKISFLASGLIKRCSPHRYCQRHLRIVRWFPGDRGCYRKLADRGGSTLLPSHQQLLNQNPVAFKKRLAKNTKGYVSSCFIYLFLFAFFHFHYLLTHWHCGKKECCSAQEPKSILISHWQL